MPVSKERVSKKEQEGKPPKSAEVTVAHWLYTCVRVSTVFDCERDMAEDASTLLAAAALGPVEGS